MDFPQAFSWLALPAAFHDHLAGDVSTTESCDDLAVLDDDRVPGTGLRSADVIAENPVSLMTMSVWNYRSITEEHPELADRFRKIARFRGGD